MNVMSSMARLAAASILCATATQAGAWSSVRVAYAPSAHGSHFAGDGRWPLGTGTLQDRWRRPVHYVNDRPDIGSWRPVEAIHEDYDEGRAYARHTWRPYFYGRPLR